MEEENDLGGARSAKTPVGAVIRARAANVRHNLARKLAKPLHLADEMLHPFYFGIAAMELATPYSFVAGALAIVFAMNFIIGASGGPET